MMGSGGSVVRIPAQKLIMPQSESEQEPQKVKPKLSQVVAGIVASVVGARAIADASALRVARFYLQHELLKGLPVPRMRFKRVSISLPVVLEEFVPEKAAVRNNPEEIARLTWEALAMAIQDAKTGVRQLAEMGHGTEKEDYNFFDRFLESASAQYDAKEQELKNLFARDIRQAFLELDMAEGGAKPMDTSIVDAVGEAAETMFRKTLREFFFVYIDERLKEKKDKTKFDPVRANQEFDKVMKDKIIQGLKSLISRHAQISSVLSNSVPPDFLVDVNTDIVKNAGGGASSVTNLSFVLLEEGLEWLTETRDGVDHTKLSLE